MVTKSGSNAFHGGLFEYVRNNNMDARNFFDGASNSVLKLNQFGGSIGGPIKKDKLFFFVSQENFFQRAGLNFVNTVPSAAARAKAQANAATNPKIAAILPLLAAYPVGQQPSSNPLLDIARLNSASKVNEFYGSLRLDYHLSDNDTFSFRYFRDQGDSFEPLDVTSRGQNFTLVPQNAMLSWTRVISPTVVNEFKLGLNASKSRSTGIATSNVPGLDLAPITVSFTGAVAIPGIGGQGASAGAAAARRPDPRQQRLQHLAAALHQLGDAHHGHAFLDQGQPQHQVRRRVPADSHGDRPVWRNHLYVRQHRRPAGEYSEFDPVQRSRGSAQSLEQRPNRTAPLCNSNTSSPTFRTNGR